MPFVEVFSPPGTPRPEQRAAISSRLVAEVMAGEGAPDTESARAISWLVWHDLSAWVVGGASVDEGAPPTYVVRVSVPAASLTDEKRTDIVARVTRVLSSVDDDPDRFNTGPAVFVLLTEIPEGNWGSAGAVFRFEDIASYVLNGTIAPLTAEERASDLVRG